MDSLNIVSGGMPTEDQWQIEVLGANGNWEKVSSSARASARGPTMAARALSSLALKKFGFDYVIVNREDELGRDILDRTAEWNMELMTRVNDAAILRMR